MLATIFVYIVIGFGFLCLLFILAIPIVEHHQFKSKFWCRQFHVAMKFESDGLYHCAGECGHTWTYIPDQICPGNYYPSHDCDCHKSRGSFVDTGPR